jgi:hypothetical protein
MTTRPGYVWDAVASEWVEIGQAAVVAPIAYQASQPSSPATGDIWIDSDEDVPSVDSTLYYRWTKTMSGGETSLSGTDDNSLALKYTPGYESVFINGVLQVRGSDYVATTGTTVTGLTALTASDVVMVESIIAYSVGDTYTQTQIGSLLDAKSPVSTTGLVLLNSTTFTAQTTLSIDNVFTSTYANYKILISLDGSGTYSRIQMRTGGTNTAGTVYDSYAEYVTPAVTGFDRATATSSWYGPYANNNNTCEMVLHNPNLTKPTLFNLFFNENRVGTGFVAGVGGGSLNNSTSYDGLTLFVATGTITGTIKIYGYK